MHLPHIFSTGSTQRIKPLLLTVEKCRDTHIRLCSNMRINSNDKEGLSFFLEAS